MRTVQTSSYLVRTRGSNAVQFLNNEVAKANELIIQLVAENNALRAKSPFPMSLLHSAILQRSESQFRAKLYDDAVFCALKAVEAEIRKRVTVPAGRTAVQLVNETMGASPQIQFSTVQGEQEGAAAKFRGAFAWDRNRHGHSFQDIDDPMQAFELLCLASNLMRMLEAATITP